MKKLIKFIPLVIFIVLFSLPFVSKNPLVAHDWPLLFKESRSFSPFWYMAWDYMGNGGIGVAAFKTLWIDLYANFVYFISNTLNIPWYLSQRIFWLIPFLILSLVSSFKFSKLFIKDDSFRVISSLIYTFNTYILLIVAGGQFGIAFSYAIAPIVLLNLINLFERPNKNNFVISALFSGIIIALDPRVALLSFAIALLWFIFNFNKLSSRKIISLVLNFLIAGLINFYWILPVIYSIISKSSSGDIASYSSLAGVKFLSFATLENTISFLHPNWPENIFGKIYFQRPEFLIITLFAFGSLIFKVKKEINFLVFVSLIGIFFAKGTNDPFGEIYLWLFQYLPGFTLFRDSTKFYLLIAVSFSILIPFFLNSVSEKFGKTKYLMIGFFTCFYLILLRPIWTGELTGIFKPREIPQEYVFLNSEIKNFKETTSEYAFSRVLWVPKRPKYGYFDPSIPSSDSEVLFKGKAVEKITEEELANYSIGYIIVPTDPDGEIFLKDRRYSETERRRIINKVEKIDYLQRMNRQDSFKVYLTYSQRDLFSAPLLFDDLDRSLFISWEFKNPAEYILKLENAKKGDLVVFSQGFDSGWTAKGDGFEAKSEVAERNLNSFRLPKDGSYNLEIYYKPQEWVNIGILISGGALLVLVLVLALSYSPRKS